MLWIVCYFMVYTKADYLPILGHKILELSSLSLLEVVRVVSYALILHLQYDVVGLTRVPYILVDSHIFNDNEAAQKPRTSWGRYKI